MTKRLLYILLFCLIASFASGATYTITTGTTVVDGDTFCGGSPCTSSDTIIIAGGSRGSLRLEDFDGDGSYITIKNEDTNRVIITHDATVGRGVLSFDTCKYIDVRGDNNSNFEWSSDCKSAECYGIKVENDGSPNTPAGTVWIYGESDHIKLGYIEIDYPAGAAGGASSGIVVQDANLTSSWTFDTLEIHHNYIHDTRYAGMYLGHNYPHSENNPYTANFSVHDNLLEDLGSYGIGLKGSETGSVSSAYNNIIRRTALITTSTDGFKSGIKVLYIYGNAYVNVYNNWIEHAKGPCLNIREAANSVYGNTLLGCGSNNDVDWGHAIRVHTFHSVGGDGGTVQIYDNIIIEAKRYGINGGSDAAAGLYRNIIAESGVGEWTGDEIEEGTTDNSTCDTTTNAWGTLTSCANVYQSDADDVCFTTWSDDSDYSNDDFDLCCSEYPFSDPVGCGAAPSSANIQGVTIH